MSQSVVLHYPSLRKVSWVSGEGEVVGCEAVMSCLAFESGGVQKVFSQAALGPTGFHKATGSFSAASDFLHSPRHLDPLSTSLSRMRINNVNH